MDKLKITLSLVLLLLIKDGDTRWCFNCSEFDGKLKCPKCCDRFNDHVIESESDKSYCTIGFIDKTVMFQVSIFKYYD